MISTYLRSGCCDARIVQSYEQQVDLFPIRCTRCGQELGAPGIEDVPNAHLRIQGHLNFRKDMVAFKIGEMIAARARTVGGTLFRFTGI